MEEVIVETHKLYDSFEQLGHYHEKYACPFPIGVFGTLRQLPKPQGNTHRMYTKDPVAHMKAFLPHYTASGIWLEFKKNASAVIELFFYNPEDFPSVIERVDMLEGFSPDSRRGGYWRTLMNVRALPDDFEHDLFEVGIRQDDRDLQIPPEEWENFPSVPAWVYSNPRSNAMCSDKAEKTSPILWVY